MAGIELQSAGNQHEIVRSEKVADYSILARGGVQWFNRLMTQRPTPLSTHDHSRDSAGLTYVYPVISRRSGGISLGINLNPNNACNWRCIYCQVPDLRRGSAPPVDLPLLEKELREFLQELLHGNFMAGQAAPEARHLKDIALSGNGEPTSAAEFEQVIELIAKIMGEFGLTGHIKLILITNGSLVHRPNVRRGLKQMESLNGEIWFKLDSATSEGRLRINHSRQKPETVMTNLRTAAKLCPTWIQTAVFALDGQPPEASEREAYLGFLSHAMDLGIPLRGVLLYGLARPSMQADAPRLTPLTQTWVDALAADIRALGLETKSSA
jgi:wyosine [tRNA(Phe)-imidazoG37] synthetase (radical SAM superfamily)